MSGHRDADVDQLVGRLLDMFTDRNSGYEEACAVARYTAAGGPTIGGSLADRFGGELVKATVARRNAGEPLVCEHLDASATLQACMVRATRTGFLMCGPCADLDLDAHDELIHAADGGTCDGCGQSGARIGAVAVRGFVLVLCLLCRDCYGHDGEECSGADYGHGKAS